ncbi:ImmA/IrrE family metallo-endopeptidase [Heyndrickxia ginsengihumi]|uniref:ImmA/IrrE family metallo-endopeptidase n=1 Tax=Heyndrickxia ginsengihumi TaxID=363870 RepID=UPI001377981B|nr:ImmA/IrrE family metallo-endopeptidase [Heyndrickxia ginsengihumi]
MCIELGYVNYRKRNKKQKTNNPFDIATKRNIIIRYFPLGNTLGFYMKNARQQVITINNSINDELMKYVCAHELGHAILHPNENTPFLHKHTLFSRDKIEVQANYFATHLLLYGENLQNYETTYELLRSKGIPFEMERFI